MEARLAEKKITDVDDQASTVKSASKVSSASQKAMEKAIRDTIRRESLHIAKRKHDLKMQRWLKQENKMSLKEKKSDHKDEAKDEEEGWPTAAHPDDMLRSGDEISETDEESEKLALGGGGATKPISALPPDTYISTWTYVVPAAVYHRAVEWRSTVDDGIITFDKEKCHKAFRQHLRSFTKRMRWHVSWQMSDLHSACFEESSANTVRTEDLRNFTNENPQSIPECPLNHCHILVQYEGNSKRGTMCRIIERLTKFLNEERNFQCYGYTVFDDALPRPLHSSREKQQTYLLTCQYRFIIRFGL